MNTEQKDIEKSVALQDKPIQSAGTIPNLADWRFNRYLTMQLLPLFYLLLLLGALVTIGSIVLLCFYYVSMLAGLIALILSPIVFLITFAVIRAALEYLIMAHRIMRIIERMDALPTQVTDLSTRVDRITRHVDQLIEHVDDIHASMMDAQPLFKSAGLLSRLLRRNRTDQGN